MIVQHAIIVPVWIHLLYKSGCQNEIEINVMGSTMSLITLKVPGMTA